jgi:hypothetical protein
MRIPIFSSIRIWLIKALETNSFERIFGFYPSKLISPDYEREVLFKLGLLAKEVVWIAELYLSYSDYKTKYDKAFHKYDYALDLVRLYAPEFGARIPHWSLLPNQLESLVKGNTLSLSEGENNKFEELIEYQPSPKSLFH